MVRPVFPLYLQPEWWTDTSIMTCLPRFGNCSRFISAAIRYLLCLGHFLLGRAKFNAWSIKQRMYWVGMRIWPDPCPLGTKEFKPEQRPCFACRKQSLRQIAIWQGTLDSQDSSGSGNPEMKPAGGKDVCLDNKQTIRAYAALSTGISEHRISMSKVKTTG